MKAVKPARPSRSVPVAMYPLPNRVVTPPEATDPNTVTDRTPAVRASVLVDVAIHHVEVARFLRKPLERIRDPVAASEPTSLTNGQHHRRRRHRTPRTRSGQPSETDMPGRVAQREKLL